MLLILESKQSGGVKRREGTTRQEGKKGVREEGTKEGKERGKKKDFFCQTQSRIDYPARAAVGA
ncbi:hypothetical protein DVA76_19365, partial [Acinetobacter baumannii]